MSKKSIGALKFLNNASENTIKNYNASIRRYEEFHGTSIDDLVCEALDEQTRQVPPHMLKIIDRLEDFQNHLVEQDLVYGTINTYMTKIKSIYHKNRVAIPYIEPLNSKRVKRREYIEFKDIPTKDELRCALKHMRPPAQARAMAMIQGGLSNEECEHLSLRSFIDENKKYHKCDDDLMALGWLANESNPIIWVTRLIRVKTGKPYYALIGSEAVNKIAEAKLYEYELKGEISDKLLNTHKIAFNRTCREVSKKCGFPLVAEESKIRPHMLRKFNATNINGSALTYEESSILSNSEIDEMQGRGKTDVQDTYIKTNPIKQKVLYAKVLNNVSLHHQYDYEIIDDDVILTVRNLTDENKKLSKKVKNLEHQLQQKQQASEKVDALRKELGDDMLMEIVQGILNTS